MLKIIPLGGLGEIGLNMMIIEDEQSMIIIDAGLMFPEDYMLGVDYVIPDMSYIREKALKVAGVILTHAHEDHIGALPYLLRDIPLPVYGTSFTLGMVRHKLEEHELLNSAALHEISADQPLRIGSFQIEFIRVSHSVVDGIGLALKTPYGYIIHTGDFKINHSPVKALRTDINKFARLGGEGVLLLLSDSTNVEKPGYTVSDAQIGDALKAVTDKSTGRIIVALFASSIVRIQQIIEIARTRGCKVIFNGRSIESSVSTAYRLGYLDIPADMEINVNQVQDFPDHKIVIITTGSQGEPMSALARMANGFHKQIIIRAGDTVILSSKMIPGNERNITAVINKLYRLGANVVYENISSIHVSGHAFREELKLMLQLTRPRYFIPVHGEYRHLVLHVRLAEEIGIPRERALLVENGNIVEVDQEGVRIHGTVTKGRVLVDGKGIDVGRSILNERRALSEDGFVAVSLAFDEDTGIVVYGPEIVSRGFIFATTTGYLLDDAICVVLEIIEDLSPEIPRRLLRIRERIIADLRKYFNFTIKRRPVIFPFIMEV